MVLGDPNITKKGLLALKDSKPVPITAHSHEIIVPCVYTETVKQFMRSKGIKLPLTPQKLAELRKIAKQTDGKYKPDAEEKLESLARGGSVVHSNVKGRGHQVVNVVIGGGALGRRKKRKSGGVGRSRLALSSMPTGLIRPPMVSPPALPPMALYNTIRPFSVAPQSMGVSALPVVNQEREEKKMEELLRPIASRLDAIDRRYEDITSRTERILEHQMMGNIGNLHRRGREREEEVIRRVRNPKEEKEEESDEEDGAPQPDEGPMEWTAAAIEAFLAEGDIDERVDAIPSRRSKTYKGPTLNEVITSLNIYIPKRATQRKMRDAIKHHLMYGASASSSSSSSGH